MGTRPRHAIVTFSRDAGKYGPPPGRVTLCGRVEVVFDLDGLRAGGADVGEVLAAALVANVPGFRYAVRLGEGCPKSQKRAKIKPGSRNGKPRKTGGNRVC